MRKAVFVVIAAVFVIGLAGCATTTPSKETVAEVVVDAPRVKMGKKAEVLITGEGYAPGQELTILFTAVDGVMSDIGYALKPKPVANASGEFATVWSCGRFVAKKLIKEGLYTLTITDDEYNTLAEAPVYFYK